MVMINYKYCQNHGNRMFNTGDIRKWVAEVGPKMRNIERIGDGKMTNCDELEIQDLILILVVFSRYVDNCFC